MIVMSIERESFLVKNGIVLHGWKCVQDSLYIDVPEFYHLIH